MERKRFGVTYFLRKARTNKAGLTPILARITTNGVSKEIYIQCSVPADKWNQSKERATGKDKLCQQVNSYLDDYRARILAVRQELIAKGYEGNCIQIKERLQNPTTLSIMFLAELEKTSIYLNVLNKTTKGLYANTGPLLYNINNDIS